MKMCKIYNKKEHWLITNMQILVFTVRELLFLSSPVLLNVLKLSETYNEGPSARLVTWQLFGKQHT
jgi:hypothetical protein